jgi:hypothetical protein
MLGMAFYYQERIAKARRYFSVALRDDDSRESASQWLLLLDRETASNESEPESEADREIEAKQKGDTAPAVEGPLESEIS